MTVLPREFVADLVMQLRSDEVTSDGKTQRMDRYRSICVPFGPASGLSLEEIIGEFVAKRIEE